jgi:hypothetical protein
VGEPRNFALGLVSWGDRKPGGCHRGDKAEARRAASAQEYFPSRRAREKKGRWKRKVTLGTNRRPGAETQLGTARVFERPLDYLCLTFSRGKMGSPDGLGLQEG